MNMDECEHLTSSVECQLCFETMVGRKDAFALCHNCGMQWCRDCAFSWFKQTLSSKSHHCPFCREKDEVTLPFVYRTFTNETSPDTRTIYSCLFGQVLCWAILFVFVLMIGWLHERLQDDMFYIYMIALTILAIALLLRLRENLIYYYGGDDALDDDEEAVLS